MSMQGQTKDVYSATNTYKGGLEGLQPFIEQVIQIIDTKASFEHVKGLMLETFGGNDIMDQMPSDVEVAAVVGGANPTPASAQHCKIFACASRARPYDRFCVYRAICALNTKIAKTHCAQSVKCALRAIRKAAHSAVYAFWPKQHCAQCAKRL